MEVTSPALIWLDGRCHRLQYPLDFQVPHTLEDTSTRTTTVTVAATTPMTTPKPKPKAKTKTKTKPTPTPVPTSTSVPTSTPVLMSTPFTTSTPAPTTTPVPVPTPTPTSRPTPRPTPTPTTAEYIEFDDDDEDTLDLKWSTLENGRIRAAQNISSSYFGYIIGKSGSVLKKLISETHTDIKIPPRKKRSQIVITGTSRRNICNAAKRINMIALEARKKQKPNFFLSIPIYSKEIMENAIKFKDDILKESHPGVEEVIFSEPISLHLTLFVFFIDEEEEKTAIKNLLDEVKETIINPLCDHKPIPVTLSKIAYMNDDPTAVHVLYAEIQERNENQKGLLTELFSQISEFFLNRGYEQNKPTTKLHVTLMNTRKRQSAKEDSPSRFKRIPFDGSKILKEYQNYHFGDADVSEIHLSEMQNREPKHYYTCSALVKFK